MKNSEQPINPTTKSNYNEQPHLVECSIGLTKREYFAGLAMQGLVPANPNKIEDTDFKWVAKHAISYADALLSELEKTNQ